jgi:hypothetical protein
MSKPPSRPLPRTPVALSVLNLLNERPMHPYEMRSLMRERGHDRAFTIRESSVYDAVARLAARGFGEPVEVRAPLPIPCTRSRAGTGAGVLRDQPARGRLVRRAAHTIYALGRGPLGRCQRLRAAGGPRPPSGAPSWPIFGIEEEHARHGKAELAWVRATIAELRDGSLPWPTAGELGEVGDRD